MARGGPMQFVLNDPKELLRLGTVGFVVGGQDENVLDLQVHPLLGRPNVPNPLEHLVEVIGPVRVGVLETLVVKQEPFDQILGKP